MVQLLEALSFIHQRKIAHLDIKVFFFKKNSALVWYLSSKSPSYTLVSSSSVEVSLLVSAAKHRADERVSEL
jgi:hypothetical protein